MYEESMVLYINILAPIVLYICTMHDTHMSWSSGTTTRANLPKPVVIPYTTKYIHTCTHTTLCEEKNGAGMSMYSDLGISVT